MPGDWDGDWGGDWDGLPGEDLFPGGSEGIEGMPGWHSLPEYIAYLVGVSVIFLITLVFLHFLFPKKHRLPFCIAIGVVCLAVSGGIMFWGLRHYAGYWFCYQAWDIIFFFALATLPVYAHFALKGRLSHKIFYIFTVFMFYAIISISIYLPMPKTIDYLEFIITLSVTALLLIPAYIFRKKLAQILDGIPVKFIWLFAAYAIATGFMLQYWREEIIWTKVVSTVFIVLPSAALFVLMFFAIFQIRKKLDADSEKKVIANLEEAVRQNYEMLLNSIDSLKISHHDSRHHYITLSGMLEQGNLNAMKEYLLILADSSALQEVPLISKNTAVDSVVKYYIKLCRLFNIDFTYSVELPEKLNVSDPDISSALSNCLENAIKAVKELSESERKIALAAKCIRESIVIKVKNNFLPDPQSGTLNERKEGLGLKSVSRIAEKYKGKFSYSAEANDFEVSLLLQA